MEIYKEFRSIRFAREWKGKEGVRVPIIKKGEGENVEEYREVTLMQTAYKMYASVLPERLRNEIEKKNLLPPNQTEFRRGMGTIYTITNYLINR